MPRHNPPKINAKLTWEENWVTSLGAWIPGERVVMHGQNILSTMKGKSWMEMFLLGITGHTPEQKTAQFLDALLALIGCYPDPRLWNNRVSTLAGTCRSTPGLAVGASISVSDAIIYGAQPACAAFAMLYRFRKAIRNGDKLDTLIEKKKKDQSTGRPAKGKNRLVARFPGYGRPTSKADERIAPFMEIAKNYGFDKGEAVTLSFKIEKALQTSGYPLKINIAALIAAFCLDQNLTEKQFYQYFLHCFNVGFAACHMDATTQPEGSFFPMRCEQIFYSGVNSRQWVPI